MSAASPPSSVKQWLAQHALRKVAAPALTFDDHTKNVAWAQRDWLYHLGLYGPETHLSAVQQHLAAQLPALNIPVLLIGTSADALSSTGLLHGKRLPSGVHTLILSPHAPDQVVAALRLRLTLALPERPLQAALIFSSSLPALHHPVHRSARPARAEQHGRWAQRPCLATRRVCSPIIRTTAP